MLRQLTTHILKINTDSGSIFYRKNVQARAHALRTLTRSLRPPVGVVSARAWKTRLRREETRLVGKRQYTLQQPAQKGVNMDKLFEWVEFDLNDHVLPGNILG